MSWSLDYTGTPAKVAEALEKHAEVNKMSGASLTEYEAAKPALVNLVLLNFNGNAPNAVIRIVASGSGYDQGDGKRYSSCLVKIEWAGAVVT